MKRKNVLFFPCSFFFFFLSNTKLIPAPRHGFSETVACSVSAKLGRFRALHLAIFAREGKEEREKRGKKEKKNARRHPLETKFFRKRISLFGSELCPLSQVFTIRAWGSIEWWNWRGSRHHRRGTIRFFQNQRDQGFCAFEKVSTTLRLIASIKNESNVTIGRDRIVNINESAYSLVIKEGEGKREGEAGGLNLDTSHLHLCYKCNVILMQRLRVECKRVRMRRAHRATMVR